MRGRLRRLACLLGAALSLGASAALAQFEDVGTVRLATQIARPVFATSPPGDRDRLFIVEQHTGRIEIFDRNTGSLNEETPFLTVTGLATGNEQGLLGLAFHPSYATRGLLYVNKTRPNGDTVILEYRVSEDPDVALPTPRGVLEIHQPQANHNGGWLAFGPDGFLYIAVGDGGNADDQGPGHVAGGNAQDIGDNLLGKILRIDVDGDSAGSYGIPPSNPFVGVAGDDEIWAYGLRHPWRASFDRSTGDFYIGDVGQNTREEIDFQPASSSGGENYGWRLREGTIATPSGGVGGSKPAGAIDPIYDYARSDGATVVGGYVYRGPAAALRGRYFFADFGNARIWSFDFDGSPASEFDGTNFTSFREWTSDFAPDEGSIDSISSFAEDADGNLYILELGNPFDPNPTGELFMVVPTPTATMLQSASLLVMLVLARRRTRR